MEELKDIKPDIEIINSALIDNLFVATIILLALGLLFLMYRFFKRDKRIDKKQASVLYLKSFDFDNLEDKQIAYEFTKHGYITLEEHFNDEFLRILKQLETYKYKKDIPQIDDDLKEQMRDYIKVRIR
jgi:hypothetical protein